MRPLPAILFSLLPISSAAPIQNQGVEVVEVVEYVGPVVTQAPAPAVVKKLSDPEPAPGTVLLIPPPLFDPSEPRPDPLFESSQSSTNGQSTLRAPPIQEQRHETLLPFDGAHVHPLVTPYTPEDLPGTCAFNPKCRMARNSAEIGGALILLCSVVYVVIYLIDKLIRKVIWTAQTRARSPSGSLRLEPEIGNKFSESQQLESEITYKNPLVKVWCEKGIERIIYPVTMSMGYDKPHESNITK